ncbi:hypothetical protein [Bradyrhizobium sp. SZCCHNR2028]|uniref:hypothetical protein n=1 Tax=Bradyrhizobium sp. SZCCHNR2028 TaxID=3057382 RepID=UPI003965744A
MSSTRRETAERQSKRRGLLERTLLVDQVAPVDRKQHLRKAGEGAIGAARDVGMVATPDSQLGIIDAECDLPLEARNNRVAQAARIGRAARLQSRQQLRGIVQRAAERDLAHPDRRDEAMRMAWLVVHLDPPFPAVVDHAADRIDLAIEQVDFVPVDSEPAAADDPLSPAADRRQFDRLRVVDEPPHCFAQRVGVEVVPGCDVEPDVVVRARLRGAART